jgi:hypothetical protein
MFIVKLDKERHAKVTRKALSLFQEKTGKDILNLKEGQALDLADVEILLWLCLLREDPTLTLEQIQDEVELHQLKQFTNYILEGKQSANPT